MSRILKSEKKASLQYQREQSLSSAIDKRGLHGDPESKNVNSSKYELEQKDLLRLLGFKAAGLNLASQAMVEATGEGFYQCNIRRKDHYLGTQRLKLTS